MHSSDFKDKIQKSSVGQSFIFLGEDEEEKLSFALSVVNFFEKGEFKKPEKPLSELLIIEKEEGKGEIGIDLVREIKKFIYSSPALSSRRAVIIKDAGRMNEHAQNAVLKIVEEPPHLALILFIAKTEQEILPTLISRMQKIYFSGIAGKIKKGEISVWKVPDKPITDDDAERIFTEIITDLRKDLIQNSSALKEVLQRLKAVKKYNTNKKLQLKALFQKIKK